MSETASLDVQFRADASQFYAGIARVNEQLTKVSRSTAETSRAVQGMAGSMRLAGASIAAFVGAQALAGLDALKNQFVDMVEGPRDLQASFAALLGDAQAAGAMLQSTFAIARRTGTAFGETSDIVRRLAIGMRELGGTNDQVEALAEGLLKMGRVSGASTADITGTVVQFAQALASGKAQGDELRSIMERFPALAQMIAQSMGVTVGELRKLGSEGKITADILANAVLKNGQEIARQYAQMPLTIGAAMNNVRTSIVQAFNTEALQAGVSGVAEAINRVAGLIDRLSLNIRLIASDVQSFYQSMSQVGGLFDRMAPAVQVLSDALDRAGGSFNLIFNSINPLGAMSTRIVTSWGEVKVLFTHELPAWIARAQSEFFRLSAMGVQAIADLTAQVSNLLGGALDGLAERMRASAENLSLRSGDYWGEYISETNAASEALEAYRQRIQAPVSTTNTVNPVRAIGAAAEESSGRVKRLRDELEDMRADALEKINQFMFSMLSPAEQAAEKARELRAALIGVQDSLDPARVEQIRAAINSLADGSAEAWRQVSSGIENSMTEAFSSMVSGAKSAKEAFADMAKSILEMLLKILIQALIVKPIVGAIGGAIGFKFAKGGVFETGGRLTPFATGGIVSGPTPFAFGGGRRGIMGEAGPEAIVPLRRHGGSLGVAASPVNVTVNNNAGADVLVEERTNSDGSKQIDVMIERKVKEAIGSGAMDRTMAAAYGLKRRGT